MDRLGEDMTYVGYLNYTHSMIVQMELREMKQVKCKECDTEMRYVVGLIGWEFHIELYQCDSCKRADAPKPRKEEMK